MWSALAVVSRLMGTTIPLRRWPTTPGTGSRSPVGTRRTSATASAVWSIDWPRSRPTRYSGRTGCLQKEGAHTRVERGLDVLAPEHGVDRVGELHEVLAPVSQVTELLALLGEEALADTRAVVGGHA